MKNIPMLFLGLLLTQISAADDEGATPPKTTLQIGVELSQDASKADAEIDRYLKAIRESLEDDDTMEALNKSQKTWSQFREEDCEAIRQHWASGTVRDAKYFLHYIHLTKQRTYELWRTYLTYADSTPARLPRPKPMKDYRW